MNTKSSPTSVFPALLAASVLLAAASALQAEIWRDDFTGDRLLGWFPWSPRTCEKVVKDGLLIDTSRSNRGWGPRRMWAGVLFGDGTLTMRGKAIVDPADPFRPNIGATVKHFAEDRYLRVLVGLHNDVRMIWRNGGQEKAAVFGNFTVELNKWYDMKISVRGSELTLTVGGKRFETAGAPFAGKAGHPGFYAETPFAYDFIEVDPVRYAPGATLPSFEGLPMPEPMFAAWRPDAPTKGHVFTDTGSLFAYYRNRGDGPIEIETAALLDSQGREVGQVYARQHPFRVGPGGSGQFEIRIRRLPNDLFEKLFARPKSRARLTMVLTPRKAAPIRIPVTVTRHGEDLQINFISFGPDLKTVYVYVQSNRRIAGGAGRTYRLQAVTLNGKDVTKQTTFGAREAADNVVPLVIRLDEPLRPRSFAVVTVATSDGLQCGHALRAFAGEFPISATLLGRQVRRDAPDDLYNHCFTALGTCGVPRGQRKVFYKRVGELGMGLVPFAHVPNKASAMEEKRLPRIVGIWTDEIPKRPRAAGIRPEDGAAWFYRYWYEPAEFLARMTGRPMPFQFYTPMAAFHWPRWEYLGQADGISQETCEGMKDWEGWLDRAGRLEFRRSRRPFWPYFRRMEVRLHIDRAAGKTKDFTEDCRRPISPAEERFYTYAALINGAKGIIHWPYASYIHNRGWLRLGMGAALAPRAMGVDVPESVHAPIRKVWDEMGKINAELQTVGPLVARSDVGYRARVLRAGGRAEAVALVSGLDALVLVVLNHNYVRKGYGTTEPSTWTTTDISARVALPSWIEPKHVFEVRHDGLKRLSPAARGGALRLDFKGVEVGRLVVIAGSDDVLAGCRKRLAEMRKRLDRIGSHTPRFFQRVMDGGLGYGRRTKRIDADKTGGVVYLSDLAPASASQWSFKPKNDANLFGEPLQIEDTVFARGVATHAHSVLSYRLNRQYERFKAWVGIDESSGDGSGTGTAEFRVYLDGHLRWRSGRLTGLDPARPCEVSTRGATEIGLVVHGLEDGKSFDHGDWADARLIRTRQ